MTEITVRLPYNYWICGEVEAELFSGSTAYADEGEDYCEARFGKLFDVLTTKLAKSRGANLILTSDEHRVIVECFRSVLKRWEMDYESFPQPILYAECQALKHWLKKYSYDALPI